MGWMGRNFYEHDLFDDGPVVSRRRGLQTYGEVVGFSRCGSIQLPQPTGFNINMIPFRLGDRK